MERKVSGIYIEMNQYIRSRFIYFLTALLVIALGLLSRKCAIYLPHVVNTYLGDMLWALMIFLLVAFVSRRRKTVVVALISILFCYAIEISQLYHAPWIDQLRNTVLGGLVLGFGFLWTDILAYTIGVGVGALLEILALNYFSIFFFKFRK